MRLQQCYRASVIAEPERFGRLRRRGLMLPLRMLRRPRCLPLRACGLDPFDRTAPGGRDLRGELLEHRSERHDGRANARRRGEPRPNALESRRRPERRQPLPECVGPFDTPKHRDRSDNEIHLELAVTVGHAASEPSSGELALGPKETRDGIGRDDRELAVYEMFHLPGSPESTLMLEKTHCLVRRDEELADQERQRLGRMGCHWPESTRFIEFA